MRSCSRSQMRTLSPAIGLIGFGVSTETSNCELVNVSRWHVIHQGARGTASVEIVYRNAGMTPLDAYAAAYAHSLRDPEAFWAEAAQAIAWDTQWDAVLDATRPPFYKWFRGGMLNTCYNAVDRH